MESKSPTPRPPSAFEDWQSLHDIFAKARGNKVMGWSSGMSPRLHRNRLSRLLGSARARSISDFLKLRSDNRVKALRTYAAINMEQASSALRLTVIINVSIPIIFLTIFNQVFPGALNELFTGPDKFIRESLWFVAFIFALSFSALIIILAYGTARLSEARDIRHLIDLAAAERGIYFGLEDMDDMQSDPT